MTPPPRIAAVVDRFPELLAGALGAVPDAWDEPVAAALEALALMGVRVFQVKEKFGALRIHTEAMPGDEARWAEAQQVIQAAAAAVEGLCATCGRPAIGARGHYRACGEHLSD